MPYGLAPGSDLATAAPLDEQRSNLGEYLDAVADGAWHGSPLPSILRWQQRQAADFGALNATARLLGYGFAGMRETLEQGFRAAGAPDQAFAPRTRWLTKEEAQYRGSELGLQLDRAMSEESFDSIVAERRRRLANEAVYERARKGDGYGPGRAALSVLVELATSAVDPINVASAFIPVTRLPIAAAGFQRIGSIGVRRLARGATEGAVGAAAVEPLVAAAALDEDPNYGFSAALLNVAFGTALGAGLHWLGGKIADRYVPQPARAAQPSPRDVLEGAEPRAESVQQRGERPAGETTSAPPPDAPAATPARVTPQETAARVEALRPETKDALGEVALRQAANDLSTDVHVLATADANWRPFPAHRPGPAFRLGGWNMADIARELAEQRSLLADLAARRDADTGRRFKAPPGFQPSPAELQRAKDYVRAVKGSREPESLATFVRRKGGLDPGDPLAGDLRAQDLKRAGLLRAVKYQGVSTMRTAGRSFDEMAEAATEAGYFKERPSAEDFAAALIEDASGRKVYSLEDMTEATRFKEGELAKSDFDAYMAAHPLGDPRDMDAADLAYLLKLDPVERRLAELDDLQSRGVISREEAVERAALIDRAAALEEEAAARDLLDAAARPEGFEKELEGARSAAEDAPLTEAEAYGLAERSGFPETPPGDLPGGAGRSAPAGGGEERGAPGAVREPQAAADTGAVSRAETETFGAEGRLTESFNPREFEAWIKRQADWRADAHADEAASARADAVVEQRSTVTPEQDLAELTAATAKILDEQDKAELKLAAEPYREAKTMIEAFAACRLGGGDG